MYDVNLYDMKKRKNRFLIIIIILSLLMILIWKTPYIHIINYLFYGSSTTPETVVLENQYDNLEEKDYTYSFSYKGKHYSCYSNTSANELDLKKRKLFFDSHRPNRCHIVKEISGFFPFLFLLSIIFSFFIILSIHSFISLRKKIKIISYLNQNGKLVKRIPYSLTPSQFMINGDTRFKPVVSYPLSNGLEVSLYGDAKHYSTYEYGENTIDMIIDENHPDIYYINFNINRLTGNLERDFYQNKTLNEHTTQFNPIQSSDKKTFNIPIPTSPIMIIITIFIVLFLLKTIPYVFQLMMKANEFLTLLLSFIFLILFIIIEIYGYISFKKKFIDS